MEMDEVTEFIKKILLKSEALQYCEHFKGISDEKFKSYSFEDLTCVLPSTEEGELAAAEIKAQIELAIMMEKVKAEKLAGGKVSSFFQATETEGQAACTDECGTGADGISVEVVVPPATEIEVVTLDSDEDQPEDGLNSCVSSDEENSDPEYSSRSESSASDESDADDGPCPKRQRQIELASTSERQVRAPEARMQPVLNLGSSGTSIHSCRTEEGREDLQWYDDDIHGHLLTTINAYQWCWKPLSHRCQYNLFRILSNSPNMKELNIFNDATDIPSDIEHIEGSLSLLKLKKLQVHLRRNMDTGKFLRAILKRATTLKVFEYKFSTETEEDLGLLGDFDWSELQSLSVFSLSSPSYLTKAHLENLLRVRAPQLNELRMGIGLYEDVSGDLLENVLKNFPTMQTLYIPGQYYSHSDAHPAVTIDFPKLSQLKSLVLGGRYLYAAVWTTNEKDKSSALEQESSQPKPFRVTLKFCRILSKLKRLLLGNMHHIDSLHLSCFPKLETLYVGSPWHLSVVFPVKKAHSYNYPLITSLQLPDGLNDASFLRNIPERFPNIKKCSIRLPSAHVLRTFFNVMKDVGLQTLLISTQFDFSSTLESCLLDKVLPVKNSSEDWKRVTKLEKCVKWNEFVDQNNITLPLRNDEEVRAFEEATGECGLGAMKHLDKFYLTHVPRISHLCLGESNDAAATSTIKLGYWNYPISTECCDVVRRTSTQFWWDLKEPAGEREKWMAAGHWASPLPFCKDAVALVEARSAMNSNLKDERREDE